MRGVMKYKGWTDKEKDYMRQWYGEQAVKEIANVLGRSEGNIKAAANRFGFARPIEHGKRPFPGWLRHELRETPQLPVSVLLQGRYVQGWEKNDLRLYLTSLVAATCRKIRQKE